MDVEKCTLQRKVFQVRSFISSKKCASFNSFHLLFAAINQKCANVRFKDILIKGQALA